MYAKILEEFYEKEWDYLTEYCEKKGITGEFKRGHDKRNRDLKIILEKTKLLKAEDIDIEKVKEYFDELTISGIKFGVLSSVQTIKARYENREITKYSIHDIDTESLVELESIVKDLERPTVFDFIKKDDATDDYPIVRFEEELAEMLMEIFDVDYEDYLKIKNSKIRLKSKGSDRLKSHLFTDNKGKYEIEYLINTYIQGVFRSGANIGAHYGEKILIEDLKDNKITFKDLIEMEYEDCVEYFEKGCL